MTFQFFHPCEDEGTRSLPPGEPLLMQPHTPLRAAMAKGTSRLS